MLISVYSLNRGRTGVQAMVNLPNPAANNHNAIKWNSFTRFKYSIPVSRPQWGNNVNRPRGINAVMRYCNSQQAPIWLNQNCSRALQCWILWKQKRQQVLGFIHSFWMITIIIMLICDSITKNSGSLSEKLPNDFDIGRSNRLLTENKTGMKSIWCQVCQKIIHQNIP